MRVRTVDGSLRGGRRFLVPAAGHMHDASRGVVVVFGQISQRHGPAIAALEIDGCRQAENFVEIGAKIDATLAWYLLCQLRLVLGITLDEVVARLGDCRCASCVAVEPAIVFLK